VHDFFWRFFPPCPLLSVSGAFDGHRARRILGFFFFDCASPSDRREPPPQRDVFLQKFPSDPKASFFFTSALLLVVNSFQDLSLYRVSAPPLRKNKLEPPSFSRMLLSRFCLVPLSGFFCQPADSNAAFGNTFFLVPPQRPKSSCIYPGGVVRKTAPDRRTPPLFLERETHFGGFPRRHGILPSVFLARNHVQPSFHLLLLFSGGNFSLPFAADSGQAKVLVYCHGSRSLLLSPHKSLTPCKS